MGTAPALVLELGGAKAWTLPGATADGAGMFWFGWIGQEGSHGSAVKGFSLLAVDSIIVYDYLTPFSAGCSFLR